MNCSYYAVVAQQLARQEAPKPAQNYMLAANWGQPILNTLKLIFATVKLKSANYICIEDISSKGICVPPFHLICWANSVKNKLIFGSKWNIINS